MGNLRENGEVSVVSYQVGPDDRITSVDDEWMEFAIHNDAPELTPDRVKGRTLFDFIAGEDVRQSYMAILYRLRTKRQRMVLPFRCDSPGTRRFMFMQAQLEGDGLIRFTCITSRIEYRDPIPFFDRRAARRKDQIVVECSCCNSVKLPDGNWLVIEDALKQSHWSNHEVQPRIVYSICNLCQHLLGFEEVAR